MENLLTLTSEYLIEVMTAVLVIALVLRFLAQRSSVENQIYYSTFTHEIEKRVEKDDISRVELNDIEGYIESLLDDVSKSLPSRGLRMRKEDASEGERKVTSVREYASGSQGFINSLKGETNAFKANQQPSFEQLTTRVMSKDSRWVRLNGLPIDSVTRMIDVLPGIFIVIGIFGTFVGITNALPSIAQIDFNNLSSSSSVLSQFVNDVSFAMYTSIAGIGFSLIMSLLNTLSPIASIRDTISRDVEDCLEYLWYFVHGGRAESQQTDSFARMIELLDGINTKMEPARFKEAS